MKTSVIRKYLVTFEIVAFNWWNHIPLTLLYNTRRIFLSTKLCHIISINAQNKFRAYILPLCSYLSSWRTAEKYSVRYCYHTRTYWQCINKSKQIKILPPFFLLKMYVLKLMYWFPLCDTFSSCLWRHLLGASPIWCLVSK